MSNNIQRLIAMVAIFVLLLFSVAHQINLLSTFNQIKNKEEIIKNDLETKKDSMIRENATNLKVEIERKVSANLILPALTGQTIKINDLDDALIEQQQKQVRDKYQSNQEINAFVVR